MKEISRSDARPGGGGPSSSAEPRPLVLYVEDSEENRQVASMNLGTRFHLLFATDDKEACGVLTRSGKALSIILMDIELKNSALSGMDLCRIIRGKRDRALLPEFARDVPVLEVPILFLTAHGNTYQKSHATEAGGNDLLLKPIDFVALKLIMAKYSLAQQK